MGIKSKVWATIAVAATAGALSFGSVGAAEITVLTS